MTDKEILNMYILMVDFIADICGPSYEVLLHDVSMPQSSVIAIRNGHHSGRAVGYPMTELALKIMQSGDYKKNDYIANYNGYSEGKKYLSSTYFIKNGDRLIGMLCINNNMSSINNFQSAFEALMKRFDFSSSTDSEYEEHIDTPVESLAYSIIDKTINAMNMEPERLTIDEKIKIVHELDRQGIFILKGGVAETASKLKISEATVYRYLNKK